MKSFKKIPPLLYLGSFLLLMFASGSVSGVDNFESLKVLNTVLPAYPTSMTLEGIYDGSAQVVIRVDSTGELDEVFLSAYTHPLFGRLADEYIRKWTFQPAKLNGEPITVIKPFDFRFEDKRGVYAVGVMESTAAFLKYSRSADFKRIYSPRELDEIPEPITMTTPMFPLEFKDKDVEGSATILFYIDSEGNIRMPHVTESTHDHFGQTALLAVWEWKFKPPMVRGKPVDILARQEFKFSDKK
ncbi:MAG: TonB family protein [Verrucomicrobia bacterium]|nr:TonB family protein [Verrucomicrobiota bacterium]MDA1069712.1 TonB family protein [Verrucomicrobiota bacterium]